MHVRPILLAPHHDDETLFAAFTIARDKPRVIIVLESHLQEQRGNTFIGQPITNEMRQRETAEAIAEIHGYYHCPNEMLSFWPFRDDNPDWHGVRDWISQLDQDAHVYAPAFHRNGHEHHNWIADLVAELVPWERRTFYATYERGDTRVTSDREVEFEPDWIAGKFRGLACYASQHELWPHHFLDGMREYYL